MEAVKANRNKLLMITAIIIGTVFLELSLLRPLREREQIHMKTTIIIGTIFLELSLWKQQGPATDSL